MADWAALHTDILVLIAKRIEIFEDFIFFYSVCKSWHSVTSVLGKLRILPSRFPFVMLTDRAEANFPKFTEDTDVQSMLIEEVEKNEQIEGMQNRPFYSFSSSKVYEFELPEATRKKCLGAGYGLLLTIDFDLQINILNPFTRQQISMPGILAFKNQYADAEDCPPQEFLNIFVRKVTLSSNPFDQSNQDCILFAIYGPGELLAFARPGDDVWTNIIVPPDIGIFYDVMCYKDKFYAVNNQGVIVCGDINDANGLKATPIAFFKNMSNYKYLVESDGDILLVVRICRGPFHNGIEENPNQPCNYTDGFMIFKLEECNGDSDDDYPYKLTEVTNLGNNALFIGNNASVSVPASRCVKPNSIYFSEDEVVPYMYLPFGGGYDTGIYDVESGNKTLHYASKFMSRLTPPIWIVS